VAEFSVFVSKQQGSFSKAALVGFKQQNMGKFSVELGGKVDGLDPKLNLQLAAAGGGEYLPLPNANSARWTATVGSQPLGRDNQKVKSFVGLLQGLERIFDPSITGAFEIPEERAPDQNLRFTFATDKFVKDHVCNITKTKGPEMVDEARAVATRRMVRPVTVTLPGPVLPGVAQPTMDTVEFTNIPASSTLDLNSQKVRNELRDEITSRQREFEAIYRYLVSAGRREQTLLQGDHEEVMYTSKTKIDFYECTRPHEPTDDIDVVKYPKNYLRYAVQKVGEQWLLHHMAGRAAEGQVNTAPNANFQAFNYANVQGVAAVPGTFSRVG
jgi:hypothetical protein